MTLDLSEFGPCRCPIRNRGGEIVPHWRSLVDSKYLSHWDLQGRDVNVRIAKVVKSDVVGAGGVKSKKAVLSFDGKEKGMVAGVSVLSAIAGIYGDDTDRWIGQSITIYPTTTEASGKTVGTIRVRPRAPQQRPAGNGNGRGAATAAREPGADDDPEDRRGDEPGPGEMP